MKENNSNLSKVVKFSCRCRVIDCTKRMRLGQFRISESTESSLSNEGGDGDKKATKVSKTKMSAISPFDASVNWFQNMLQSVLLQSAVKIELQKFM